MHLIAMLAKLNPGMFSSAKNIFSVAEK